MRMFPIDVEIRLSVCANNYEEARQTVIRGLHDGRYVADANLYYAHGDGKNRRRVKFSPFDVPTKSDDVKWVADIDDATLDTGIYEAVKPDGRTQEGGNDGR